MRVIGTAGHVDHGKSALILALTGINPDRLREEQERQMTIDLGFAWMNLPNGEEIGFVDVPGHRDFIDNMLAGVGGIEAALFIVAADEGVMPQTKEHLAILDLLEIRDAIVVLTKIDLIEDQQWIDLIMEEVRELINGTSLENAEFACVSALTGSGLEELKNQITGVILKSANRPDLGKPRLSIDRVFTIAGFGTVVTGTLLDGVLNVGDEVEILPKKLKARIRGLQSHKKKVESVYPGSRTAVNLTGIDVSSINRGDIVARPGTYKTTTMVDVKYRHLPEIGAILKHDQHVKMFIGAAQTLARVRVLGLDKIEPGEEGWLQLVLEESILAVRGDHYILRRPSPGATLGGGRIADPHPKRRHRLKDLEVIQRLGKMLEGSPAEVLTQALIQLGPTSIKSAIEKAGLNESDSSIAISELIDKGELIQQGNGEITPGSDVFVSHQIVKNKIEDELIAKISDFHKSQPLKFGILKEELKSRSKLDGTVFSLFLSDLINAGKVIDFGIKVSVADYEPQLSDNQKRAIEELLRRFNQSPYSPPTVKECISEVGDNLFLYLIESNQLTKVSAEVIFEKNVFEKMVELVRIELANRGTLSVAEVRDLFSTSRKYALAFLEYLDSIKITRREGDVRRLSE